MWHVVTTDLTRDPPSTPAHVWALEQETRPRAAADKAAQAAIRASRQDPLQWAGAAADEFPPGFAEFAAARTRGVSVACAGPRGT